MRVSPSASSLPASRSTSSLLLTGQPTRLLEGGGEAPLLALPFSLCSLPPTTFPKLSDNSHPPSLDGEEPLLPSTLAHSDLCPPSAGLWLKDTLQKLRPLLRRHMMFCIGSAFVFSNHPHGGAWKGREWMARLGILTLSRQPQPTRGYEMHCPVSLGQPPSGVR